MALLAQSASDSQRIPFLIATVFFGFPAVQILNLLQYFHMQAKDIEQLIEQHLPNASVMVHGDDGVHFEAVVISEDFAGKSLLQQHRLVYAALGGRMEREEIHALSLKTYTPEAWRQQQS